MKGTESEIELQFDEMTVKVVTAHPAAIFRIIKALQEDRRDVEVRYYDEEIRGNTCWQPMKRAA